MVARERADGQPSRGAPCAVSCAHLQHGDCPGIAVSGRVGKVGASLNGSPFVSMIETIEGALSASTTTTDKEATHGAAEIAERQARLLADHHRVHRLRAAGFRGPEYEIFRAELAAYAYPVIRSWIRRRLIYQMCKELGRGLEAPDDVREYLSMHAADRQDVQQATDRGRQSDGLVVLIST